MNNALRSWEELPAFMRIEEVRPYYEYLRKKKATLVIKRAMDFVLAVILLILLSPVFVILAIWIKKDSKGPVFYRQIRLTQYGRKFHIFKFRTMVQNADKIGTQVTVGNDSRITKVGEKIRKYRLDELPQLINVLLGDMSFVGTRPEVEKYVKMYQKHMLATLLLPAGITSTASLVYKDEGRILETATDVDKAYAKIVLPQKMKYNLDYLAKFSIWNDIKICLKTVFVVLK